VRRRQAPPALERHALKDPWRPAALMHAYIVVSLMAGVRPEEAKAIGWEEERRPGRQSSFGRGAARGPDGRGHQDLNRSLTGVC